jgi:hypothetical protein
MDIFVPILKVDAAKREVYGVMAEEAVDKANEIFDYASSKPHIKAWSEDAMNRTAEAGLPLSFGNVRTQHSKVVAGKLVGITFDDSAKRIPIVAKIVDDNEWKKVQDGVYTGFSIGGSYVKRWADGAATRYTAKPAEVSIVDNPCMYGATFKLVKADGASEYRDFAGSLAKSAPVPSVELAALRVSVLTQMDELTKKINDLLERRSAATSPASFQHDGGGQEGATVLKAVAGMPVGLMLESEVLKSARQDSAFVTKAASSEVVARAELEKALANGRPVTTPEYERIGGSGAGTFRTVESVAPGVQQYHNMPHTPNVEKAFTPATEHRQFQPDGENDLTKAEAAVKHALANGKRV